MKFTIDRSKWRRGCGPGVGVLLGKDGLSCCLGFFGAACGVNKENLLDVLYPVPHDSLSAKRDEAWPKWLFCKKPLSVEGDDWRTSLAIDNDSDFLEETKREAAIAAGFAANGVEVEFIDGTEPK